ncbi:MAG: metallophosphoesterase family protein [Bacteroidota bacterium]
MNKYFLLLLFISIGNCYAQIHKNYEPTKFPDRVILGWQGNASASSQSVNFRTDSTITKSVGMIAEAGADPEFVKNAITLNAVTESVIIDRRSVLYHTVHFDQLKPNTQYAYKVGSGDHWSEWFHFKTASDKNEPFSFLYFGDAQNDLRSLWSRTIRGAYSKLPSVQFMIHAGDLINNAFYDWQWGEWFEAGGFLNGMVPSLASPGNHEYGNNPANGKYEISTHWKPTFVHPENGPEKMKETTYFIDYQGVRFISLNSQIAFLDSSALDAQAIWLEELLAKSTNQWKVVFHHHPIYSTKSGRDNEAWRNKMEPIYKKYNIDLVLQGHDHTYGRGINMPLGKTRKYPDGPIYVVSVSGPKMYDIGLQDWMDRAGSNIQLYQIISLVNNKLSYKSYDVTGQLYDAFDLTKDTQGKKTLKDYDSQLPNERLALPIRVQERNTAAQNKEYESRFQQYKKRKAATKK